MISDDTFFIDCPDGREKLSNSITKTSDIFNISLKSKPKNDNKLCLLFDSIYIQKTENHHLLEIGYSPSAKIELINLKEKTIYFTCQSIDYNFQYKIYSNHTCYDAECYFSSKFYTAPCNIIIQYKGQKLNDDCYLFDLENSEISPFTITFKKGYQLYYTFLEKFSYVCMKSTSTLKELKESLTVYNNLWSNVFYGKRTSKFDENSPLSDISDKIIVFDFNFITNSNQSDNIKPVTVNIIENDQIKWNKQFQLSEQATIYSVTCLIEDHLKLDRSLFTPFNNISLNTIIKNIGNNIFFNSKEKLQITIDNEIKNFPLTMTIEDVQNLYNFKAKNFGIVINKKFVSSGSNRKYLSQYLNSGAVIEIKRPNETCHICSFKKKDKKKLKNFIVPDKYEDQDKIVNLCLKKNVNFVHITKFEKDFKTNNRFFEYTKEKVKSRKIEISFFDNKDLHEHNVEVKGKNPRIIDLLTSFKDQFKWYFKKKEHPTLSALFGGKKLLFWQFLSEIAFDRENKILINMNKNEKETKFKVLHIASNKFIELNYDSSLKATEIIKKIGKKEENLALFMDFYKLQNDDCPLICTIESGEFLIANSISDQKKLNVTNNSPLKIQFTLSKLNYHLISSLIIYSFNISDFNDLKLHYKMGDKATYELPQNFDAGSLIESSNCEITVDYAYKKSNKLTFFMNGKRTKIELSNIDAPISSIKSEILKKMDIPNSVENSIFFNFINVKLNENYSFSQYKILEDATIYLQYHEESFKIRFYAPENNYIECNILNSTTVGEVKKLISESFNYHDEIEIKIKNRPNLSDDMKFNQKSKYHIFFKKVKIKSGGSLGEKVTEISCVLRAKMAKSYINKKIFKNCGATSLFIKNERNDFFEEIDDNLRLCEINSEIFVHKYFVLDTLRFENVPIKIKIDKSSRISECNTVGWFQRQIVANKILWKKKFMLTSESGVKLNELEKIGDSVKITTNIEFFNISAKSKNRRKSIRPSYSEINDDTTKLYLDQNETEIETKTESENKTEIKSENKSNIEPENKTEIESDINEEESINDENNDDNDKIAEGEEEDEEDEEEDENMNLNESDDDDDVKITYKFQIGLDPVIELKFKESATVESAKIKIARMNDGIDPSYVLILFAGKNLKKSINLKSLRLKDDDILQVYIRKFEEILLMSAKAFNVHGRGDISDNYSDYEEDYDD